MKKLFFVLAVISAALIFSSCGSKYTCTVGGVCEANGKNWEACCTSSKCYYKTGSERFHCDGLSCFEAAEKMTNYCSGVACDKEDMLEIMTIVQEDNDLL